MKYLLVFNVFVFLVNTAMAVPATVDYVVDGDTFAASVDVGNGATTSVRVRVINVDTPEIKGACSDEIKMANQAKDFAKRVLPRGARVELKNIKDDKYVGRIDANVILSDGRDFGNVLIDNKLGRRYSGGKRADWCK